MAVLTAEKPVKAVPAASNPLYRPEVRQAIFQAVVTVLVVGVIWMMFSNAVTNLRKQNVAAGFDFLDRTSGFDISQSMIDYSAQSTFGRAIIVGLVNTLVVSAIGIVLATAVGFVMGIARLSSNWLIARIATVYVETARNIPLLLQLFVWYFAVLQKLPDVFKRDAAGSFITGPDGKRIPGSYEFWGGALLNNRGLIMPRPEWLPGSGWLLYAFVFGIAASVAISLWARRRQMATGARFPILWTSLALILGLPALLFFILGRPVKMEYPVLGRFNLSGGMTLQPEMVAMILGLVFYTGGYIAEVVRAGIAGVASGQKEAARALGLPNGLMMRLVVIPQAMRIIIPPLTSQYLNLTKNSSLGIAIAYPDLTHTLANTTLNQTNQAIETIGLLMAIYLTISLLTSAFMNWFNKRMALVER